MSSAPTGTSRGSRSSSTSAASRTRPARHSSTGSGDRMAVMSPDEVAGELRSGMTIGIGGWGSRRKPMALVRAILRTDLEDLEIVSYGGPDVGLLCAAGRVREVVFG